jgi:hypothetical protein
MMNWLTMPRRRVPYPVLLACGAAVLAGILAACGPAGTPGGPAGTTPATSAGRPGQSAAASGPASPATSPVTGPSGRSGFAVLSMSFVSDSRGFALGTVPCGAGRCVALLTTTDGGATWRALTPPTRTAASYGICAHGSPCVQQVRFATPRIGYAFDPSLLMTTDGGRSWRRLPAAGVSSLEAANGTVVRVASPRPGCSGLPYQVQAGPSGGTAWSALTAPPIVMICPPVLYRQGSRLVLVGYGNAAGGVPATARIDRSANDGRTWAAGPDRCGGKDGYASGVAIAPPDVLVLLCRHQTPLPSGRYGPAWVRVSTNGGATFGPDQSVPSLASAERGLITGYQIAAAGAGRLLVAETASKDSYVLLSTDGGRTWSTTLRPAGSSDATATGPGTPGLLLVGFQDGRTARIAQGGTVWTTTDGGRTWRAGSFGNG